MRGRRPGPSFATLSSLVAPPPALPTAPDDLPIEARVEFQRVAAILYAEGLLCGLDATILELYAGTYGEWKAALAMIEQTGGPVVELATGPGANPYATAAAARKKELLAIVEHLGLSPLSRQRLMRPADIAAEVEVFARDRYALPAPANGHEASDYE